MRLARTLSILVACSLLSSCSMFNRKVPNWASSDVYAPGPDGTTQSWVFQAKGDKYVEFFYESVVDGAFLDVGRAENHVDGLKTSVGGIVSELRSLHEGGDRYVITTDEAGKFQVRILHPGEGLAAYAGRKMLDKLGIGDDRHSKFIALTLNELPAQGTRIHSSVREVEWRLFGAVSDLEALRTGEKVRFAAPGVTPEQYGAMLEVLVVALQHDLDYLRGLELGVFGVVLAAQDANFENPYSVANIEAVLLAILQDAEVRGKARPGFVDYPPAEPVQAEVPAKAQEIVARVSATPEYEKWKNGSHAARELKAFAKDAGTDLKSFSALTGVFFGVDLWAQTEKGIAERDVAALAGALAAVAPQGSSSQQLFKKAERLSTVVQAVAGDGKEEAAPKGLVLVENEEEARRIHAELQRFGVR